MMPLPPRFDYTTKMYTVEDTPDVTYNDIGGCTEQIQQIREVSKFSVFFILLKHLSSASYRRCFQVVEWPMLHPEKFVKLGLDPPRGVLCYGPPGTGKTLLAKAVANRTAACFIRVIGTELVHKNSGMGASMVRQIFQVFHMMFLSPDWFTCQWIIGISMISFSLFLFFRWHVRKKLVLSSLMKLTPLEVQGLVLVPTKTAGSRELCWRL